MVTWVHSRKRAGYVALDLIIAMSLLTVAILPLAFSFRSEQKLMRACYHRAIATELVDGEFELLVAGGWRQFPEGTHTYQVSGLSRTNLPPGEFRLTRAAGQIRLEWIPDQRGQGGRIAREAPL